MVHIHHVGTALCGLSLLPFVTSVEWTPADFDWNGLRVNDTAASGLWMYKHEAPDTTDLSMLSVDHPTTADAAGVQQIGLTTALGIGWRVASFPAFGLSLKNTINSCKQTANKEAGVGPCLEGVFGTIMAFGGAASATKNLGHRLGRVMMPHRFLEDGTVNLVCVLDPVGLLSFLGLTTNLTL